MCASASTTAFATVPKSGCTACTYSGSETHCSAASCCEAPQQNCVYHELLGNLAGVDTVAACQKGSQPKLNKYEDMNTMSVAKLNSDFACTGTGKCGVSDCCEACPIGTYKDVVGSAGCAYCPNKMTTSKAGATSLEECKHSEDVKGKKELTQVNSNTELTFDLDADLSENQVKVKLEKACTTTAFKNDFKATTAAAATNKIPGDAEYDGFISSMSIKDVTAAVAVSSASTRQLEAAEGGELRQLASVKWTVTVNWAVLATSAEEAASLKAKVVQVTELLKILWNIWAC